MAKKIETLGGRSSAKGLGWSNCNLTVQKDNSKARAIDLGHIMIVVS